MIDVNFIKEYGHFFIFGVQLTLIIAFLSCLLGTLLGGAAGIILAGKSRFLRFLIMTYVIIIRGTPMLIQITATYFLLQYIGFPISALYSAILSIGLNSGAYVSQIVLSGIKSVSKGQIEAAKVLGFTQRQTITLIVLPQALRNVLPALGNEFVTLVKDSSLASTIGVYELTQQGNVVFGQTYDAPAVYLIVGIIYLCLTSVVSLLVSLFDKKLNKYAHR
ncbi:MAG TPA: amino acid ABC transporter permease [Candidatus Saccharimonadales bacterium]|nr:amino acid ABC transporter permease [Candidatus Saccharimonadales bacterium]